MLGLIGVALVFLWWIISPFLPKDRGSSPVVHNNIHIINSPVNNNTSMTYEEYLKRQEREELQDDNILRDRIRF
jgi:hypothetical protein